MRITAIRCNNCKTVFRKTKNGILFKGDCCPFCGVKDINTTRIDESKLTTED